MENMENPIKMDDLGGFPTIFGNTHHVCAQGLHVMFATSNMKFTSLRIVRESGTPQGGQLQCFDQRLCDSITLATGANCAFLEHDLGVIQGLVNALSAGTERKKKHPRGRWISQKNPSLF